MDNKKEKPIIKIKDEMYLVTNVLFVIVGIIGVMFIGLHSIFDIPKSSPTSTIYYMAVVGALVKGIVGIVRFYYSSSEVEFYENYIYKPNGIIKINTDEVTEIYKISFLFILDDYYSIRRHHLIGRIFLILITPIMFIFFLLSNIFKKIYYRKDAIHDFLLIIGKNDKQMIKVQLPLSNDTKNNEFIEYCKEYLNTDITKLKTNFFIPNNETWFIKHRKN